MSMYLNIGYIIEYKITYPAGHSSEWSRWRQTKVFDFLEAGEAVHKLNNDFESIKEETQCLYQFRKRPIYINLAENE